MWLLHAASEQHGWSEKTSMWPCLLSWMYSTRLLSWWYWHKMSRMQVRSYWNIVCWMVYRLVNLTAVDNYNDLFRPYYIIRLSTLQFVCYKYLSSAIIKFKQNQTAISKNIFKNMAILKTRNIYQTFSKSTSSLKMGINMHQWWWKITLLKHITVPKLFKKLLFVYLYCFYTLVCWIYILLHMFAEATK